MSKHTSNRVTEVVQNSPANVAGLRTGDKIVSINDNLIRDELDLAFYSHDTSLKIKIRRGDRTITLHMSKDEYESIGVVLAPLKIHRCKNNCIFCFVRQLPKGLRQSLYVKDEDYRFSFLFGNYVTLSNLNDDERKRIIDQKLSPLYISVHTTNHELRKTMLGNKNATDIMDELKYLKSKKIKYHTQIVLCPGYNDGKKLENTIRDLGRFYPYMMSIAVVPVGLTKHRKKHIDPVLEEDARNALSIISMFQKRFLKKFGDPVVYGSDELFIKADLPFPSIKQYGDFPQIENGVGMVRQFIHKSRYIKPSSYAIRNSKFITFTGLSFYPFLSEFIETLNVRSKEIITLIPAINHFFGDSITVTGLLTGKDIIKALSDKIENHDIILIPDVVLKDADTILLDDVSIDEIRDVFQKEVRVIESTPVGLLRGMEENYEYQC